MKELWRHEDLRSFLLRPDCPLYHAGKCELLTIQLSFFWICEGVNTHTQTHTHIHFLPEIGDCIIFLHGPGLPRRGKEDI